MRFPFLPWMSKKPRENLVIIGTGWGSFATLKNVNKRKYNVTVVSPRSYFLFTPMLASSTVGTVDFRAIIDPIRLGIKFRSTNHYQWVFFTESLGFPINSHWVPSGNPMGSHWVPRVIKWEPNGKLVGIHGEPIGDPMGTPGSPLL